MKRQNNVAAQRPGTVIKLPRFERPPSCKILRNLPNSPQPQFPHLPNDDKNNVYTMQLLWGLNEVRIHVAWQKCQLLLFLAGTSSVTEQSAYAKSCFFFFFHLKNENTWVLASQGDFEEQMVKWSYSSAQHQYTKYLIKVSYPHTPNPPPNPPTHKHTHTGDDISESKFSALWPMVTATGFRVTSPTFYCGYDLFLSPDFVFWQLFQL